MRPGGGAWRLAVAASLLAPLVAIAADRPIHLVTIDALVSDARGRSVETLTAADFELKEDGTPHALESAVFVRPTATDPRRFAVFLDEYQVSAGASTMRVREALTRFVDRELGPDDLLFVMKPLESIFNITLTRDRESARRSIETFEGRKGDYTPRNSYERNFIAGEPDRVEAARSQVAISAINALAQQLGRQSDRRKTLILVTEALGRPAPGRGREYLTTLDTAIRTANKARVSVYVANPGDPGTDDATDEPRRMLASRTEGQLIPVTDLESGLARAARESAGYYLLSYRSGHDEDGAFHPVALSVKRTGLVVRARSGFFAPSPDDKLRATLLARAAAPPAPPKIEPPRHISPLIRTWFGLSRAAAGNTRVMFVWEPAQRVPGERSLRVPTHAELTVLAPDDSVVFQGPVKPTGPTVVNEEIGASARASFESPPGRLRLRISIEDQAAQVLDVDVRDLVVRDWRAPVMFGTPEVLRARNAREFRTLGEDQDATPVVGREFSRTERLLIRFSVYAASGDLRTTARLVGRSGQAMRDLVVDPAGSTGRQQIDVPLAGLAPGEYAIEFEARTAAAGDAKERLEFRVTN